MMVKPLLYAYTCGIPSSRTIARRCVEVEQNLVGADLRLTDTEVAQLEEIMQGAAGTIRASTPLHGPPLCRGGSGWAPQCI